MHKSKTGTKFWNSVKQDIVSRYVNGESASSIAKSYDCYGSTISYKLKEWGIEKHKRYNNIYNLNDRYFQYINNEHKAYWLGFLLADGHINEKAVMLTIKEEDLLLKYKTDIGSDAPLKYDRYNNPALNIACKNMCNDLLEKGFNNNKSIYVDFYKILSFVPKLLTNHFIRGMFDGDGSIRYYEYDYQSTAMLHFGYTGTKMIVDYIAKLFNIKNKIVKEGDYTYTVCSSNPIKIKEIYNYLYKDATIFMDRKKETFEKIFELRSECYA